MSSASWQETRSELERELAAGAMIVAMTDEHTQAGGYACTVTLYTAEGELRDLTADEDLLVDICRCTTSEMR